MYTHPTALRCRKQAMTLDQGKVYTRREIANKCQMSHTTFYKFLERYKEQGEAGLYDKERVPGIRLNQTPPDVEEAILAFVQELMAQGGSAPNREKAALKSAKPPYTGYLDEMASIPGANALNGLTPCNLHRRKRPGS
ncbi:MAG: helix-turn-helix domain-containing protein [Bacillota bacterium]